MRCSWYSASQLHVFHVWSEQSERKKSKRVTNGKKINGEVEGVREKREVWV